MNHLQQLLKFEVRSAKFNWQAGLVTGLLLNMFFQDLMGLEVYIEYIQENWIVLNWEISLLSIALVNSLVILFVNKTRNRLLTLVKLWENSREKDDNKNTSKP